MNVPDIALGLQKLGIILENKCASKLKLAKHVSNKNHEEILTST